MKEKERKEREAEIEIEIERWERRKSCFHIEVLSKRGESFIIGGLIRGISVGYEQGLRSHIKPF